VPFLTQGKTNWKYILIVVILAGIVVGGILNYLRSFEKEILFLAKFSEIKKPEKIEEEIINWKIYKDKGISIRYPPNLKWSGEDQLEFVTEDGAEFFSLLILTPAVDSLESYFKFYVDKLGKEVIAKEIKSFGEVKEGIFYSMNLNREFKETGYIFNSELFTYHFWIKNTNVWTKKPESTDLFLKILSTIKLTSPLFKVSVQEINNQKVYKNEVHNIEFKYPKEWGSLALIEINQDNTGNKIYHFLASGELVSEVYYHPVSGMMGVITKGEKIELIDGGGIRQEILQIYKEGKIQTVYTVSPFSARGYGQIGAINFSPSGRYLFFVEYGYEFHHPMIMNLENGKTFTDPHVVNYFSPYKDIYWSPNEKVLAVRTYFSEFGGEGKNAIFVSDYERIENLNEVFSFHEKFSGSGDIYDLHFIDDERLVFSTIVKKWNFEKRDYDILEMSQYEYNAKTKRLNKLKLQL